MNTEEVNELGVSFFIPLIGIYTSRGGGEPLPPSNHDAHDESWGKSRRGNRSSHARMGRGRSLSPQALRIDL